MNREIKFTITVVKWFDRINEDTYHSVRCVRCKDNAVVVGSFRYGYGEYYKQRALGVVADAKWLPGKYGRKNHLGFYAYEQENNHPISWTVSDGSKRNCIANGEL